MQRETPHQSLAGCFILVPLFYPFSFTLGLKDKISTNQTVPLALASPATRKVKSLAHGRGALWLSSPQWLRDQPSHSVGRLYD